MKADLNHFIYYSVFFSSALALLLTFVLLLFSIMCLLAAATHTFSRLISCYAVLVFFFFFYLSVYVSVFYLPKYVDETACKQISSVLSAVQWTLHTKGGITEWMLSLYSASGGQCRVQGFKIVGFLWMCVSKYLLLTDTRPY